MFPHFIKSENQSAHVTNFFNSREKWVSRKNSIKLVIQQVCNIEGAFDFECSTKDLYQANDL